MNILAALLPAGIDEVTVGRLPWLLLRFLLALPEFNAFTRHHSFHDRTANTAAIVANRQLLFLRRIEKDLFSIREQFFGCTPIELGFVVKARHEGDLLPI